MIGNLEPEEHVMDDSVIYPGGMLGQLLSHLKKWDGSLVIISQLKSLVLQFMKLMVLELNEIR